MPTPIIEPEFSFRFDFEDIKSTYHCAETAFVRGDFMTAAQMAPEGSEIKACSLILGGLIEQGLDMLERAPHSSGRGQLCRAYALWSLDRTPEAKAALARCNASDEVFPQVERLGDLIDRENINVFVTGAVLSIFAEHHSQSILDPVHKYGAFTVKYVGSQMANNAYSYRPSEPLDEFIESLPREEKPDLIFALSPQWLVARNFEKVRVPKVIWCHDSDVFFYRNAENYSLYDVAIMTCSQEHFELGHTTEVFCAANIMLQPLATPFPEALPNTEKKIDVVFTGAALDPIHSEKPRFLYKLAEMGSEFNIQIVSGHLPEKDYFTLLSQTKFLPIINRYAGCPSPRWRDALTNGAYVLYPDGTFYGEVAPGCFPFRAETMVSDMRHHIGNFNKNSDPAYDPSVTTPKINKLFSIHRQTREKGFERLLKYAAFMALVWRDQPSVCATRRRRLVWLTPIIDCGIFGHDNVREKVADVAAGIGKDDLVDDRDYNNAAHLHAQLVFSFPASKMIQKWTSQADFYFREGLARFPHSLALRLNEALWCLLKSKGYSPEAVGKFETIIAEFDRLEFDPYGADMAFAYTMSDQDRVFPSYQYADIVTKELTLNAIPELGRKKPAAWRSREVIRSACYGYIGWAKLMAKDRVQAAVFLDRAIEIYPQGLPVLILRLETLIQHCLESDELTKADIRKLSEVFFAACNINPSLLLGHIYIVAPILIEGGESDAARTLLEAWHRIANIIQTTGGQRAGFQDIEKASVLWRYPDLLPRSLVRHVQECRAGRLDISDITQLERIMVEASKLHDKLHPGMATAWPWVTESAAALAGAIAARSGGKVRLDPELKAALSNLPRISYRIVPRGVSLRQISGAFHVWCGVPRSVKVECYNKFFKLMLRAGVQAAFQRAQLWGAKSKWHNLSL